MSQDAEGGMFGHFCILEMLLLLCEFRHEYEVGLYFTSSINHSVAMPGVNAHVQQENTTFSPGQLPETLRLPDGAGPVFSPQALLPSLSPIIVEVGSNNTVEAQERVVIGKGWHCDSR